MTALLRSCAGMVAGFDASSWILASQILSSMQGTSETCWGCSGQRHVPLPPLLLSWPQMLKLAALPRLMDSNCVAARMALTTSEVKHSFAHWPRYLHRAANHHHKRQWSKSHGAQHHHHCHYSKTRPESKSTYPCSSGGASPCSPAEVSGLWII